MNWFTNELRELKSQMISTRIKTNKSQNEIDFLKHLKTVFKKTTKRNIFLYEKNKFYKVEKLIKYNNSKQFFAKVRYELDKGKKKMDTVKPRLFITLFIHPTR